EIGDRSRQATARTSRRWSRSRGSRSSGHRRRNWCGCDAARRHRLIFRFREIGTERLPRLRAVTRYENAVIADIQRLRLERGVEPLREIASCGIQAGVRAEIWRDVSPLPGREIDLDQPVALAYAIAHPVNRRGLERIGHDSTEL